MQRSTTWLVNAVRRTVVALLPPLARPDDDFAARYLEGAEWRLYLAMDPRDRQHACHIARKLLQREPQVGDVLVRAALLHDVGKTIQGYNPLHRIAVHLYAPPKIPAEPRLGGLRGAWQVKRHHHRYGAQMIRAAGGDEQVAQLVERHHDPGGDRGARLLKELDDET